MPIIAFLALVSASALFGASDDLFNATRIPRIEITIPPEGMQVLRESGGGRRVQGKPEAQATVREGGRIYTNVAVQLKGYTTFRSVDSYPSLTLNFDRHAPKQDFHGLKKLSLNNSMQDATRLHEKLTREVFAAAGVPVPRADFALVTLNGQDFGLYVLAEGFDKRFLARHFDRTDGKLYEGGILRDIDQPLQIKSDVYVTDDPAVEKLIRAAQKPDHAERMRALEAVLDVDRFLTMTAVEAILCHSDSYSMNRNNYRLYHNPQNDKFVFLPHGMDRVLGAHRSSLELNVVPPMLGLVARAVLSTSEGRARYVERAASVFTNHFRPEVLSRHVREMDARILCFKTNAPDPGFDPRLSSGPTNDADNLCERISIRAAHLALQFQDRAALLTPPPVPDFDTNGVASLDRWKVRPRPGHPDTRFTRTTRNGRSLLHLEGGQKEIAVTLHQIFTLPLGNYRVTGTVKAAETNAVPTYVLRNSPSRYAIDQQRLINRESHVKFQIREPRAPDEVELLCHIKVPTDGVWLDVSDVQISRQTDAELTPRSSAAK